MMVGIGAWDAFRHESYADFDYFKVVSQDSRGETFLMVCNNHLK